MTGKMQTPPNDNTPPSNPPTNYRADRRKTDRAMLILVLFVLVVVGDVLIGLIWGPTAAITGGVCLFGGGALILGLWGLLTLIERWVGDD